MTKKIFKHLLIRFHVDTLIIAQEEIADCQSHDVSVVCRHDCENNYRDCLDGCHVGEDEIDANCVVDCSNDDLECVRLS